MFRHYQKTYRIIIPEISVHGKHTLSKDEVKRLLGAKVVVEEKMDGANTGIIRHKKGFSLQKKGSLVAQSEHAQFGFFHNWANHQNYDKIMAIPVGYLMYTELLFAIHTIYYDILPDYVLVIDIWNGKKYLNRKEKDEFCEKYGFYQVPLIAEDYFSIDELHGLIPKESQYGDIAEGIVIKRYRKKEYMRGKIVKKEFMKFLDKSDHWTKNLLKRNRINESS